MSQTPLLVRLSSLFFSLILITPSAEPAPRITLRIQQTTAASSITLQSALAALSPNIAISDVSLTGSIRRIAGSDDESGSATLKALSSGDARCDLSLSSGTVSEIYYAHPDLLGSIRLATTPITRVKYFDTAYAPFGETYAFSGTLDAAYTGQMDDTAQRPDTVGGLYDFPAREYSTQGRWPSPDPAGVAATCIKDPQSQNRYAYVRNNPITRVDPNGMQEGFCDDGDPFCWICQDQPWICNPPPPGFGGAGGGGGGETPKPRTFPWPLLPVGFFGGWPRISIRITVTTYKLDSGTTGICHYTSFCPSKHATCGEGEVVAIGNFTKCPPFLVFKFLVPRVDNYSTCLNVGEEHEAFFPEPCS